MTPLNYEILRNAVEGSYVAFRSVTRLEPVGGPGDKIYPPTFGDNVKVPAPVEGESRVVGLLTRYAVEWRRIEGVSRLCVLLDSVASQANRMEDALRDAWEADELQFGVVRVDFRSCRHDDPVLDLSTFGGTGTITSLEMPHRLADAIIQDSLLDGLPFRASEPGRNFTEASPANATAVFELCPTALSFGVWDSTGPKGGLGSKFQRALSSEIVGVGVELGARTKSRLDPFGIRNLDKNTIYEAENPDEPRGWTLDPVQAKTEGKGKGTPVKLKRGGEKAGTPSVINHGNVKPSVELETGGVTIDYAEQITVLSLPALRRLRFPRRPDGKPFEADCGEVEVSARSALAALSLAAMVYSRRNGYDLRSRCALRPLQPFQVNLVPDDGSEPVTYTLDVSGARELLKAAAARAIAAGLPWRTEPLDLAPTDKLVALIRNSREGAVSEAVSE